MMAGLDQILEVIEAQAQDERGRGIDGGERSAETPITVRAGHGVSPTPASSSKASIEDLTLFMVRLRQMKAWLEQDGRLLAVVDDCIRQRVSAMERHTNRFNLTMAVLGTFAGAVLGWLLSAAQSPEMVLQTLFRH
jgi:hypothetical protein